MHDQADELRRHFRWDAPHVPDARLPLVAFLGSKGGVGTTSLVAATGHALAWSGRPVVVVDGDLEGPDLAALWHIETDRSLADVLAGHATLHEALRPGPHGVLVLAGSWDRRGGLAASPAAHERLTQALRGLEGHAELVLVDAGNRPAPSVERWCRVADVVVLVGTAEPVALLDAYASAKSLHADATPALPPWTLLVNRADRLTGQDVHRRIAAACQRFLGWELEHLGQIPETDLPLSAVDPRVIPSPQIGELAARLLERAQRAARESTIPIQPSDSRQPIKSHSRVTS